MEPGAIVVLLVLAAAVTAVAVKSVRIMPAGSAGVVERLGRFKRTVGPGLQFMIPFVDRIHLTSAASEQEVSVSPVPCVTADHHSVSVDVVVRFRLADPARGRYVAPVISTIQGQVAAGVRLLLADRTLEEARTSFHDLGYRLHTALPGIDPALGLEIHSVEVRAITPVSG